MHKSINRRLFSVLGVVLVTQGLTACVVLPLPVHRSRGAVVVEPGSAHPHHHGDRDRRGRR